MAGTIAISNPSVTDKTDNSLIAATATAGKYGQIVLNSTGGEVGASASEGGTAGTSSGNLVFFKGVLGTYTAVGTGAGLPVTEQTLLAGEDLTNNRTNVGVNVSYANNILSFGTAGTAAIGTLVAAQGASTAIYVTGFSITPDSSALGTAEVCLSFGTAQTGTAVLFRGVLNTLTSQPVISNLTFPVNAGITNTPLTYLIISGAGSVAWNANYIVH